MIKILSIVISLTTLIQASPTPLKVDKKVRNQTSHGLGYLHGRKLAEELMKSGYVTEDFSSSEIVKGLTEAFSGKDSSVEGSDFSVSLEIMKAMLLQRETELAKINLEKSKQWIDKLSKKKEVKSTKGGLLYKMIKQGDGVSYHDFSGVDESQLKFYITYEGRLADGTVFERVPAEKALAVQLNGLPGVTEALKNMTTGSTWELYLTPDQAYGTRRMGAKVEPNSSVVFKLSLVDIRKVK